MVFFVWWSFDFERHLCKDVGFGKEQRLMKDSGEWSLQYDRVWLWIRVR